MKTTKPWAALALAVLIGIAPATTAVAAAPTWKPLKPETRGAKEEAAVSTKGKSSPQSIGQAALAPAAAAVESPGTRFDVGPEYVVGGSDVVADAAAQSLAYVTDRTMTRLAGDSRFETAIEVSKAAFPSGAGTVFVSYAWNFPDGLSTAAAGVALKAPLLLTETAAMPDTTLAEIKRLAPARVVFTGGTGVVSDAVVAQVRAALPNATMTRAGGSDRYATAAAVSKLMTATTDSAFVAVGTDFPDALAAGPAAGARNAPLLLSEATVLPTATRDELSRRRPKNVYVIGGVINATVRSAIAKASGGTVTVIAGSDRYNTAQLVAQRLFKPTTPGLIYVSGLNFPDALAGAALAATKPGPVLLDAGKTAPPSPTLDAGRFVSWNYPSSGRIIRYIPIVHPDDEFSAWSEVGTPDPRRYDVFVLLTTGEDSTYCNGKNVSNQWMSQEYLPQPQPTGVALSDRCKKHRLDSWNTFMSNVKDGAPLMANYVAREGVPITFNGRQLDTPQRYDANDKLVPATSFKTWIGPNSARISFDLGALTTDEIIWALENTRRIRGEFPTQSEGDVIGGGYHNDSGAGMQYIGADHKALYDTLSTVDLGLPGSQYSAIGHVQSGRAFGRWVDNYCSYMCHPSSVTGYVGTMGRFQYAYGWLNAGRWPSGDYDVYAGFSAYQSFGKWF